jgi:predicted ATP-grasp superfamily ATP-dependent carboligase
VIEQLPVGAFPVLLQEKISGPGIGVFLLIWDEETKAEFGHRRLREKPPSGGVSVLRESVTVPDDLLDQSERLLHAFQWRGVAMVEYKIDNQTGTPYLMEVNGRFWGSLQLAVDAGVDFPSLLVRHALGESPPPVRDYQVGVKLQWFWGDVDHLLLVLRGRGMGPGQSIPRLEAMKEFLATSLGLGIRKEVFSFGDLRPFLMESLDWIRRR